jgi:hypothetical protein
VYALVAVHNYTNKFYPVEADFEKFEPSVGEVSEAIKDEVEVDSDAGDADMNEQREEIADLLWASYCEATERL